MIMAATSLKQRRFPGFWSGCAWRGRPCLGPKTFVTRRENEGARCRAS